MPFPSSQPDVFSIFPLVFGGFLLIIFGSIAYAIISSVTQWMSDNAAPVETYEVRVIAKRDKMTVSDSTNSTTHMVSRSTRHTYFATFEYANGQRKEFGIKESEFGVLMEGDNGTLNFQGSRFNSFVRHN